jgi:hypothetical protein
VLLKDWSVRTSASVYGISLGTVAFCTRLGEADSQGLLANSILGIVGIPNLQGSHLFAPL